MACIDHECAECGWAMVDNNTRPPARCPKCGGVEFYSTWDEQNDTERGDDYDPHPLHEEALEE